MAKGDKKRLLLSFTEEEISKWNYKTALKYTKEAQRLARLQINNINSYLNNPNNIRPNIVRENNEN